MPSSFKALTTLLDVFSAVSRLLVSGDPLNTPLQLYYLEGARRECWYSQARPAPVSITRHEFVRVLLSTVFVPMMVVMVVVAVAVAMRSVMSMRGTIICVACAGSSISV